MEERLNKHWQNEQRVYYLARSPLLSVRLVSAQYLLSGARSPSKDVSLLPLRTLRRACFWRSFSKRYPRNLSSEFFLYGQEINVICILLNHFTLLNEKIFTWVEIHDTKINIAVRYKKSLEITTFPFGNFWNGTRRFRCNIHYHAISRVFSP